jgi:hypothetical protein
MSAPDDKYDAYTRTILVLSGVLDGRIDLRRPVGDAERRALATVGLDRPFAVLTAENPHGQNEEDLSSPRAERAREAANDRDLATLVDALGRAGAPFVRVDGMAPDRGYRERCVAVVLPQREAMELATRFGQLALFWFDGHGFWLLPAEADEPPVPLPVGGSR